MLCLELWAAFFLSFFFFFFAGARVELVSGYSSAVRSSSNRTNFTSHFYGPFSSAACGNRRSSEIQGTALGKRLRAWTCIYRSTPAGVAQSRHAFVGVRGEDDGYP